MLCHAGIRSRRWLFEGSAREVLEAYINHTLIGADELCHTLAFNNDEEEAEVDDAFAEAGSELLHGERVKTSEN